MKQRTIDVARDHRDIRQPHHALEKSFCNSALAHHALETQIAIALGEWR
jgi:hypothetical protein